MKFKELIESIGYQQIADALGVKKSTLYMQARYRGFTDEMMDMLVARFGVSKKDMVDNYPIAGMKVVDGVFVYEKAPRMKQQFKFED